MAGLVTRLGAGERGDERGLSTEARGLPRRESGRVGARCFAGWGDTGEAKGSLHSRLQQSEQANQVRRDSLIYIEWTLGRGSGPRC